MKSFIKPVVFLIFFSISSLQSQISYIIPDIGAPGINVYIEIIGPHDEAGQFGSDGIYMNNPGGDLTIVLSRPGDSALVTFGPLIVSWNGRMISTQVFVHPNANPNSALWNELQGSYVIPFRVNYRGTITNTVNFYIVKPYTFGDVSSLSDGKIGEGGLGVRSPRGAMLVDSMILGNKTYDISTNDCDPNTPGNQAYLPLIILSKGPIRGRGNTIIDVGAYSRDGGPGGGGAGGRYCDISGSPWEGGNGFTGGGPGGLNFLLNYQRETPGIGTGSNQVDSRTGGASLSGVPGGTSTLAYESAGGGTGHPFGTSGTGCGDGYYCDPPGGFGGGSGVPQNQPGGSGGNAQAGVASNSGQVIGNNMIVPIAGGSGGASGNPQFFPNGCSGNGGGGGGAIRIFGSSMDTLRIKANGQAGKPADGGSSAGGSGSGGSVVLQSKLVVSRLLVEIHGGQLSDNNKGGPGRIRWDLPNEGGKTYLTTNASTYRGLTTDTTVFLPKSHIITGSRSRDRGISDLISVYLKPGNGNWFKLHDDSVTNTSLNKWKAHLVIPTNDSIYYLVAVNAVTNPSNEEYTTQPDFVMSQAAANILIIPRFPDIASAKILTTTILTCASREVYDTVSIKNPADGILKLEFDKAGFRNTQPGFSLVKPLDETFVQSNDSVEVVVKYEFQSDDKVRVRDFLEIPHNVGGKQNPWEIEFSVKIDTLEYFWTDLDPSDEIDTLYLGEVCLENIGDDFVYEREFAFHNRSSIPVNIVFSEIDNSEDFEVFYSKTYIEATERIDSARIKIRYKGNFSGADTTGFVYTTLIIALEECPDIADTITVAVQITDVILTLDSNPDFGETRVNTTSSHSLTIRNIGTATAEIGPGDILPLNPPFSIAGTTPPLPVVLPPGAAFDINIDFSPTGPAQYADTLNVHSILRNLSCYDSLAAAISGVGGRPELLFSADSVDFGTLPYCEVSPDSVIYITNTHETNSRTLLKVNDPTGPDASYFSISQTIPVPNTLGPRESVSLMVRFNPLALKGPSGPKSAVIIIETDDEAKPNYELKLYGFIEGLTFAFDDSDTIPIYDFGDVILNTDYPLLMTMTNNGKLARTLREFQTTHPGVNISPPFREFASDGDSQIFDIDLNLQSPGPIDLNVRVTFNRPCYDTLYIRVKANALEGLIFNPGDTLDFGTLTPCDSSTMSFRLTNSSPSDIVVNEILIEGTDRDLFESLDTVPVTIIPTDSAFFRVKFNPAGFPDGDKEAVIIFNYVAEGQDKSDTLALIGKTVKVFYASPNPYDAGTVTIGLTGQGSVVIRNETEWDITIDIRQAKSDGIFVLTPPAISDFLLLPNSSLVIEVDFSPLAEIEYTDTVFATIEVDDCPPATNSILLRGNGKASANVLFSLPDTTVLPTIDAFRLPVYARITNAEPGESITIYNIEAEVRFNSTVFYPELVSSGRILYNEIVAPDIRGMKFRIDSAEISSEKGILTELIGATLLGYVKSSTLEFYGDSFAWETFGLASSYELDSGSITTIICEKGQDRLLLVHDEPEMSLFPNPAGDELVIEIRVLESGPHSLEIMNVTGSSSLLSSWHHRLNDGNIYIFKVDLSGYTSGSYYIIHKSLSRRDINRVHIIK